MSVDQQNWSAFTTSNVVADGVVADTGGLVLSYFKILFT